MLALKLNLKWTIFGLFILLSACSLTAKNDSQRNPAQADVGNGSVDGRPTSFKSFRSNQISLMTMFPYKVTRNPQGQVIAVAMQTANDNKPMGLSPMEVKGKETFYLSIDSAQGKFIPQDATKGLLLEKFSGTGSAGPLAFNAPYRLMMTLQDGERDYTHKCLPGRIFKVKPVNIVLKNTQTGQTLKIGETSFGNRKISDLEHMEIRKILDDGPQECWELQGGNELSSMLFSNAPISVNINLTGLVATVTFANPQCQSRRDLDGSLLGTVNDYITQDYKVSVVNSTGVELMTVKGKNNTRVSKNECR